MKLGQVTARSHEILGALARVIVGKGDVLERILAGILANGHVLIEDYPGLAKTLIARLFAQALGLSFKRLQCTPDLLPADVTGSFLFDQFSVFSEKLNLQRLGHSLGDVRLYLENIL